MQGELITVKKRYKLFRKLGVNVRYNEINRRVPVMAALGHAREVERGGILIIRQNSC